MKHPEKVAILVGGGPAPGINSVISAATIRCALEGVEVLGCQNGFQWLMDGNVDHVQPITIDDVSRIHYRGGSHLGASRANPTKNPAHLENTVLSMLRLNVSMLITIGGDDTAYSAMRLEEKAGGRIRVVHVPKTIDTDLPLPEGTDTFGYQTARHVGVGIVQNLMVDARSASRWYLVIAMGRKAGHLALGIGKAAAATLTLIPEEFNGGPIKLKTLVDTIAGAIIKRLSYGRREGVAIIAEGLVLGLDPADLSALESVERDAHGHVRIAEVNIGGILKEEVTKRLQEFGLTATLVSKNIGYELRSADPTAFDMDYGRDLGYCAAKLILSGGNAAMVTMQDGRFVPIAFKDLLDPETGRARIRMVNVHSERYAIARSYMIRLKREDFQDAYETAKLAATCGVSLDRFRQEFEYLMAHEPPRLRLGDDKLRFVEDTSMGESHVHM